MGGGFAAAGLLQCLVGRQGQVVELFEQLIEPADAAPVEVEVEADSLMIEDTIKVMTEEETILDRNLDQNRIHHQQEKLKRIQDLDLQVDLQ